MTLEVSIGATLATANLDAEQARVLLRHLKRTRFFDERMEALYRQGRLPGAIYSGRGQEGTHCGAAFALEDGDSLFVTHRDLSAQLTKGLDLQRVMAQFWGRIDGYTRGRDGNSHIGDWAGNQTFTVVSMLPDAYPVAAGVALAYQLRDEPHVALAICGDGSTSNGRWHEAINVSAIHSLPVVWVVNNNQFAYSTPNPSEFHTPTIAERASAYGIPGVRVDSQDVLDVYVAVREAAERARAGDGPTLIESLSLRWRGHAGHDPAHYMPKELLEEHTTNKDPVKRFQGLLLGDGVIDQAAVTALDEEITAEFNAAFEYAQASPLPIPEDLTLGLFTDDGYWNEPASHEGGLPG